MPTDFVSLGITAASVGFLHCVSGPDHYLPFVAMSRIGAWSMKKTVVVTVLCGVAHIASSAVLGLLGVALGLIAYQLGNDYSLESDGGAFAKAEMLRGDLAAWLLLGFGLVYFLWGIVHAIRQLHKKNRPSPEEVAQQAEEKADTIHKRAGSLTPWVLFTIFLFGPCEVLIPMVVVTSAQADIWKTVWMVWVFGITTVVTMTVIVVSILGQITIFRRIPFFSFRKAEIYGHALAGLIVLLCGVAVKLGL